MNFRRLFQLSVLTQAFVLALGLMASADEPLSMKLEMRHGPNGPRKTGPVFPGDRIFVPVSLSGLTQNSNKVFQFLLKGELRSEDGKLIYNFAEKQYEYPSQLGNNRLVLVSGVQIPRDFAAGKPIISFIVQDTNSRNEVKQDLSIDVREGVGAYPLSVCYVATEKGDIPASGKFTTGDNVFIQFGITGITKTKKVCIKLEYFQKEEEKARHVATFSDDVTDTYRKFDWMTGQANLLATEPFDGFVRLTTTDDSGNSHSVELPLVVTEALDSIDTKYLAEVPPPESKKTKKE